MRLQRNNAAHQFDKRCGEENNNNFNQKTNAHNGKNRMNHSIKPDEAKKNGINRLTEEQGNRAASGQKSSIRKPFKK